MTDADRLSAGGDRVSPPPHGLPVVAVDVATCSLPIVRPVRIGRTTYREREYAVVRIHAANGLEGVGFGYTRGLPLQPVVERLAQELIGLDVTRPAAIHETLRATHASSRAGAIRALSVLDIATWDLVARRAGLPLWRLLGGARDRVTLMMVAGYHAEERGIDAVLDEVRALLDAGVRHVKLHASDVALVTAVAESVRGRASLAVDLGMRFRSVAEAQAGCAPLDALGLAFLEDAFPVEAWRLTGELASRLRTPLAAGEDAPGAQALLDLIEATLVLRIDATASGGIGDVLRAATVAATRGRSVMTHAFPDLHAHLAGDTAVGMVEMIPDSTGVNPIGELLARRQRVVDGQLLLSEEPGHGAPLDWDRVTRWATHMTTIEHGEDGAS